MSAAEGAAPPESAAETIARLMRFYAVDTLEALALAQNRHVERLQANDRPTLGDQFIIRTVAREG